MSGGRATLASRRGRGRKFTKQAGDISAIHPLGHFLLELFQVECKFLKSLKLDVTMHGNLGTMNEIWHPTRKQAAESGREPLILARENNRDELVLTSKRGAGWLNRAAGGKLSLIGAYFRHGAYVLELRDMLIDCDTNILRAIAVELRSTAPVAPPKPARRRFPVPDKSAPVTPRRKFPKSASRRAFPT